MIRARRKLIEIQKDIFMLDIQQGQESFIPQELSQDHLPASYKFYDPIVQIIESSISDDRKEFFYSKNKLKHKNYV